ncbi:C2H2 type zinc-finger-domain-containing protein [Dichotomopilus funicola]|uniref:C2H2 type zinc-finger-domain-containing protein n=1 Tax=Dichotomopilus funicola TaxID=1934379 RepID=A0AAN6ZRF0_9PEZI|nr:C2H2 type zinc-finger-domain-containing protein [Dichotomopilus funicola]
MATISSGPAASGGGVSTLGASHPYTCNTCQVAFRNSDLQRGHMRSDWHRYNLKRRVASLPPISSEVFTEKVLQARAETTAQADKAGFERACETCQKTYYSENSFRNHLSSAKHKAGVAALAARSNGKADDEASSVTFSLGEPAADSTVDSDAEEEFNEVVEGLKNTGINGSVFPLKRPANPNIPATAEKKQDHPSSEVPGGESSTATPSAPTPTGNKPAPTASPKTCLFCNYESPTPVLNAAHMERTHGLFIPEKQYLVNLEGLLKFFQEQVFDLNECITCGKVKSNVFAVQTHMRDKAHTQIPYTTEEEQLEIGEFYDFRSTYSDDEEGVWEDESDDEEEQKGGVKLGAKRESKTVGEDGDEVMEDESWETDSDASSLDSDDLHAVPGDHHYHQYDRLNKHPHHSRNTSRNHLQADDFHAQSHRRNQAVFHDEYELHLPNGKSVGHRSLNRYFRQNLHSYPTPEERAERLAIEAAGREDEMDIDSEERPRGRALIPRDVRGLGVASLDDKQTKAVVTKGKKQEWANQKSKGMLQSRLGIKEKAPHPATYLR